MAGQPKKRAMIEELERRTRAYYEDEADQHSTLDYVAATVEGGTSLKALAFEIGQALGFEIGRERISAYLVATFGKGEVAARLADARTGASHEMAEEAIELVDAPAEDTLDVQRAASRARVRQWTAERYNPHEYGQQKGVSVNVSIGSLHLDALRAVPVRATAIVTGSPQTLLPSSPHNSEDVGEVVAVHDVSE